jgi:L-lactate dehydrogenase complex protein LldG
VEREAFLARVRAATVGVALPPHPKSDPGLLVPDLSDVDLVRHFTEILTATDGVVHTGHPADVLRTISAAAPDGPYMAWDEVMGVAGVMEPERERLAGGVPADAEGRLAHQAGNVGAVIGVTAAEAGFAESGTIVVRSGPGRPRMASLVPLIHVALLRRVDLHRSLAHWAAGEAAGIADAANVVFITGPSRTGDIEQQLNLGVHGPKELHVVLT